MSNLPADVHALVGILRPRTRGIGGISPVLDVQGEPDGVDDLSPAFAFRAFACPADVRVGERAFAPSDLDGAFCAPADAA
jgi:hypothetical protein